MQLPLPGDFPRETPSADMAQIIVFPSYMSRCAKLKTASRSRAEISKVLDGIETLYDLGMIDPPVEIWPLLTKLVEKQVLFIDETVH